MKIFYSKFFYNKINSNENFPDYGMDPKMCTGTIAHLVDYIHQVLKNVEILDHWTKFYQSKLS